MRTQTLRLDDEEAMCLDDTLTNGDRTARVQVNVTFVSDNGTRYHGTREVKVRLHQETDAEIQAGR